jgi:excisionase family DNA binding protein
MNHVEDRIREPRTLNGKNGTNGAERIISELAGHIALALYQYLRRLHREGLRTPAGVEELTGLLVDLSRARQVASGDAAERRLPPNAARRHTMTHHAPVPDRLLVTKTEAAERLSVSVRTVERLVATGSLPQVHVGRLPRFRVSDLEAYVRSLCQQQEPQPGSEVAP